MRRSLIAAIVLALAAAACGNGDDGATGDEGTVVDVTARDYRFEAPTEITGGLVTINLSNKGKEFHEAQVVAIAVGKTLDEAIRGLEPVATQEGAPIPAFVDAAGGVVETRPGKRATTTMNLTEGRYAFMCFVSEGSTPDAEDEEGEGPRGKPHFTLGMAQELKVSAGAAGTPAASATVTARDYTFDIPPLKSGKQTLLFQNDGPKQIHFGAVLEFPKGTTEDGVKKAFAAFAASGDGPPPPGTPEPEDVADSAVFGPGRGGTFAIELKKGPTYVMACFVQDREGGPPHAIAKGMFKLFSVA